MITNTLNTNEVKNAAGSEVEFTRLSIADRKTEFALINENPATPHRLSISHSESGNGVRRRRRSVVRIDKTVVSTVDSITPVKVSCYIVLDTPQGALVTGTENVNVLAEILSFCATTGAASTVLFDGTGTGAQVLLTGGL